MTRVAVALLAIALAAPLARAEGEASACARLAAALAEARRTGAIERVLGEHCFVMTRTALGPQGEPLRAVRLVVTYAVSVGPARATDVGPREQPPEGEVLRFEVRARAEPGGSGDFEAEYALALADGRLRVMTSMVAQARTARVVGGRVMVDGRDAGAWDDAIVPRLLGAFVLPALHDQALALPLAFRDLTPNGDLTPPRTLRPLEDGPLGQRRFAIDDGRPEPSSVVEVARDGPDAQRVVRITTALAADAGGRATLIADTVRVPREEHARLLAEWAPGGAELAAPVFARVLARARESGAIDRVLGLHHFTFTRTLYDEQGMPTGEGTRMLMTYDVSLQPPDAPELLRVMVKVRVAGGGGGETTIDYDVGLDGRLRTMRAAPGRAVNRATIEDGRLVLDRAGARESRPWDDVVLPKIVGVFVLPMLHDQGLPARVAFRDVTPFGELTATKTLRPRPAVEGAAPVLVDGVEVTTFVTDEGRPHPTSTVDVAKATGQLVRLETVAEFDEQGRKRHVSLSERVTKARYDHLWREWIGQ